MSVLLKSVRNTYAPVPDHSLDVIKRNKVWDKVKGHLSFIHSSQSSTLTTCIWTYIHKLIWGCGVFNTLQIPFQLLPSTHSTDSTWASFTDEEWAGSSHHLQFTATWQILGQHVGNLHLIDYVCAFFAIMCGIRLENDSPAWGICTVLTVHPFKYSITCKAAR